jgi:hypothetical protein
MCSQKSFFLKFFIRDTFVSLSTEYTCATELFHELLKSVLLLLIKNFIFCKTCAKNEAKKKENKLGTVIDNKAKNVLAGEGLNFN